MLDLLSFFADGLTGGGDPGAIVGTVWYAAYMAGELAPLVAAGVAIGLVIDKAASIWTR